VLQDRRSECGTLDRLLGGVRAGRSGALVVRGEPGVGKSALLEYLTERASGCRVARAVGVESEMELAFAGLHQLCAPLLEGGSACRARNATRSAWCSGSRWPSA
jgi:AAA ATPase domain